MVEIGGTETVYLACGATDMRKEIDGLAGLVEQHFKLDPFSRAMFVFCSKDKSKIKILQWDKNGFWLYYKRLERGRFRWPQNADELKEISGREFRWLLDGLSLEQPQAHKAVNARFSS